MRRFLPFLLLLFLIAIALRVEFFFTIAYLFFAVYLLARLWTRRSAERVRVGRRFTPRAFFGDQVAVTVTVQNEGRLPLPWLEVHESLPVDLISPPLQHEVLSLGPRERKQLRYTLNCRKRGYYALGPFRARTGDLLGIAERDLAEVAPDHLTVYPRVLPLQHLGLPTRSPLVALPARAPLFEDPARVVGVRDYVSGDSPRRIHWTATASTGRLLVKNYQPAIARETLIGLDLDEASYPIRHRYEAVELAIVVAASLANHVVVREGLPVGFATEAWDARLQNRAAVFLPPRRERAHLMSVLEALACVQPAPATPFPELLRRTSTRLAWGATLAVITGRESAELFEALAYLRRAGFAVALIVVQPGRPSLELRQRAGLLHLPVHHVWRERDLEGWG